MLTQCCVCHNFQDEQGNWSNEIPENYNKDEVSHTYCADCFKVALEQVEKEF